MAIENRNESFISHNRKKEEENYRKQRQFSMKVIAKRKLREILRRQKSPKKENEE